MNDDSFARARVNNPILASAVGIRYNTGRLREWEASINLAFSFYEARSDGMYKAYVSEARRFLEVIAYAEDQGADSIVQTLADNIDNFTIDLLANCYLEISRFRVSKNDGADAPACMHRMLPASVEAKTFILDYPCLACEDGKSAR